MARSAGLVLFDLDGTLLRGPTVCEVMAHPLGRLAEMTRFEGLSIRSEIAAARMEMAAWYRTVSRDDLIDSLRAAEWAPGAVDGVAQLQQAGIHVAIASITWDFAVSWFALRLGVTEFLGTQLEVDGNVRHVWPEDKANWLEALASRLQISNGRIAAVGDSAGDQHMLKRAALPIFVGTGLPPDSGFLHRPNANILELAEEILSTWQLPSRQ